VRVILKPPQWTVFRSGGRFRVLAAGRRFGKTYLALTELCQAAWGQNRLAWYVAPTYRQAKRIAWKTLQQMTRHYWAAKPNESDLRIELISGGTIALRGADNYDSLRGDGLNFVVLDEYASMAPVLAILFDPCRRAWIRTAARRDGEPSRKLRALTDDLRPWGARSPPSSDRFSSGHVFVCAAAHCRQPNVQSSAETLRVSP
jgi:hypothetical protein